MGPGDLVAGRFEIEAFVGEGGMGAVYRAIDRQTGELVALKKLHGSRESESRFYREARALALLSHPAIVRYVAHGTSQTGELYLAMEWLEGETLRTRLARGRLDIDESVDLARRVAAALAHAHAQGIIHRDLNPANLLLVGGRVESVKILDFGLARHRADRTESTTRWEGPMGTMGYMAPEQARGAGEVDARADLFSLGCVLFESVTGQPAFGADNYLAVLAKIVVASAPRVRDVLAEAPSPLDALVDALLAKDADERPPTAESVIDSLNEIGGSRPSLRSAQASDLLALTARERALVSVLAIARASSHAAGDTASRLERAAEIGRSYAMRAERLADGTLILVSASGGAATDQARRSARAALALRDALDPLPVALATGWALVTAGLPAGDLIDRAIRLLETAELRTIRIDDSTAGLLSPRFEVTGDKHGLLLSAVRSDERPVRLLLGKTTPCVGRDRELRTLHAIIDEAVDAPLAQAVLLTGPAGAGKSRIRYELVRQLAERGADIEVWLGRGDPMRAGSPFGVLGQALRNAIGLSEGEPTSVQERKLAARVARYVATEERDRVSEFLGELLGLELQEAERPMLQAARHDAVLMGDQIRRALEDFLAAECHAHPLVLVLEDFQWGDGATIKLLDAALRNLSEEPLVVLAIARGEVHDLFPGLWSDRGVQEIRVGALTRRAAETLVKDSLASIDEVALAEIVQRAGGNAFYLEELIRAYAEGRREGLPDTVLGMVKERIEGMEHEARRLLRAASILGQTFWSGAVATLLGGETMQAEVSEWLSTLEQREVVTRRPEAKIAGEREFAFRHALVRDAAYAMLTDDDRALGHRLAADWLERHGVRDSVMLAEHCERGGAVERALAFWQRAGADALEANDFQAAIARAEHGLRSGATAEQAAELELVRGEALRLRGEVEQAASAIERALLGFSRGSLGYMNTLGERALVLQRLGRKSDLEAQASDLSLFHASDDAEDALAMARVRTALALLRVGAREQARKLVLLVDVPGSLRGPVTRAWTHAFHAIDALLDRNFGRYLSEARAARAHHDEVGDIRPALEQSISIGSTLLELGAYGEAERVLAEALASAKRLGLPHAIAGAEHNLGLVLAHLGKIDEGLALERRALNAFAGHDRRLEAGTRLSVAMILRMGAKLDEAASEAERALELLRNAAPPLVPAALATLADIRLAQRNTPAALELAREAAAALEAPGGVEYGEHLVYRVWAQALDASGDRARAARVVAAAEQRLSERAKTIGDEALVRSFLEEVPDHRAIVDLHREWTE